MVKPTALQLAFDLGKVPELLRPTDQYYPGHGVPVIINALTRDVEVFYWGLVPSWAKDITIAKHTYNARAETLSEKPSFKMAFLRRRCLIPASSYYEWKNVNGLRVPFKFSLKDSPVFMMAGLWEYWVDADGNEIYSTTVVTCEPGFVLASYHERMPVVFDRTNCWQWMEERPLDEVRQMLLPVPAERFEIVESG